MYIYIYLVGGFNPSEKYESQIGSSEQLLGKTKFMFQTTNQIHIHNISIIYPYIIHIIHILSIYYPYIIRISYLYYTINGISIVYPKITLGWPWN